MIGGWLFQVLGTGVAAAIVSQSIQWFIERRRDRLASRNAALATCVKLEAYAVACAEAATDIHSYLDAPEHEMEPSYSIPDFDGLPDVEDLRHMPMSLAAQILNFPLVVSFHRSYLVHVGSIVAPLRPLKGLVKKSRWLVIEGMS